MWLGKGIRLRAPVARGQSLWSLCHLCSGPGATIQRAASRCSQGSSCGTAAQERRRRRAQQGTATRGEGSAHQGVLLRQYKGALLSVQLRGEVPGPATLQDRRTAAARLLHANWNEGGGQQDQGGGGYTHARPNPSCAGPQLCRVRGGRCDWHQCGRLLLRVSAAEPKLDIILVIYDCYLIILRTEVDMERQAVMLLSPQPRPLPPNALLLWSELQFMDNHT